MSGRRFALTVTPSSAGLGQGKPLHVEVEVKFGDPEALRWLDAASDGVVVEVVEREE